MEDTRVGSAFSAVRRCALAGAVVALGATRAAAFNAQVNWTPVGGIAGYRLYERLTGQPYSSGIDVGLIQADGTGVVSYVALGLTAGIANYFAVSAYDATGRESALSNELSLLVPVGSTPSPTAPSTATAAAAATSTATRSPSSTAAASASPTPSRPPATATSTRTAPPTSTNTTTFTATRDPTGTPSQTATRSATPTAARTATPTFTRTVAPTATVGSVTGATIWGPSAVPANPAAADGNAVELGVRFQSDVAGVITGIRFYKSAANTGIHYGTLWTSSGQRLARVRFKNETASGWQQASFSSPVPIAANTVYVASYHTNVGYYAGDNNYFAAAGVDRPPLHALRGGVSGGNGVYVYGASAFPTSTYLSSNYWVDVVFSSTP